MLAEQLNVPQQTQFFVGWGTLSLINAGLAQSKGRSGLLWWIFSLLLGPIATFLIVILPNIAERVVVEEHPS
jgi:type IV secretory pathway VirB2 component (pilin)